jgi:hypothetical protein
MTSGITFTLLLLGELFLMATGVAVFFFLRYRKLSAKGSKNTDDVVVSTDADIDIDTDEDIGATSLQRFKESLQDKIQLTRDRSTEVSQMEDADDDEKQLLEKRIGYLEVEVEHADMDESDEGYWNSLKVKLETIVPISNEEELASLNPLDFHQKMEKERMDLQKLLDSLGDVEATSANIEELDKTYELLKRISKEFGICIETLKMENQRKDSQGSIKVDNAVSNVEAEEDPTQSDTVVESPEEALDIGGESGEGESGDDEPLMKDV